VAGRWLELSIDVDVEAVEPVGEIFGRLGHGSVVRPTRIVPDPTYELSVREDASAPYEVTSHLPDDDQASARLDATRRALWHLQAFGLRPMGDLRVRSVDEADWIEAWKTGYVAQRIGRVVIVPSWLDEPIALGEVALRLDPGMAFGTGLHPTTRACLRLLQEAGQMPAEILDVGSGSGILALAALRLGAGRRTKDEGIDHAVGVRCLKKRGDAVAAGEPVAEVHGREDASTEQACGEVLAAYTFGDDAPAPTPIVLETIS
jgi:ribosomal protein L11 methyltransferase